MSTKMTKGFGPGFQGAGSKLYKTEYGIVTVVLFGYLIWRAQNLGGVDILQTIGWILMPDIIAFLPIGLSSSRMQWPRWGAYLYNTAHTLLVPGLVFAVAWLLLSNPHWPLLGWLGHITADRALGFGLRETTKK